MKSNIYLIGFMGTGKSTISRHLSLITGYEEIDADYEIARQEDMRIPEIFEKHGEVYFRNLETEFLHTMQKNTHHIISCGGGMVLRKENVKLMKENGIIVLLTANPETILKRVKNSRERPILNGHMNTKYIENLMGERQEYYEAAQDIIIPTDEREPEEIALELKNKLEYSNFGFDFLQEV